MDAYQEMTLTTVNNFSREVDVDTLKRALNLSCDVVVANSGGSVEAAIKHFINQAVAE